MHIRLSTLYVAKHSTVNVALTVPEWSQYSLGQDVD